MDRKSKILVRIFFALLIISTVFAYYRTMIVKDFYVEGEAASSEGEVESVEEGS
jgi:hypothetical protein